MWYNRYILLCICIDMIFLSHSKFMYIILILMKRRRGFVFTKASNCTTTFSSCYVFKNKVLCKLFIRPPNKLQLAFVSPCVAAERRWWEKQSHLRRFWCQNKRKIKEYLQSPAFLSCLFNFLCEIWHTTRINTGGGIAFLRTAATKHDLIFAWSFVSQSSRDDEKNIIFYDDHSEWYHIMLK